MAAAVTEVMAGPGKAALGRLLAVRPLMEEGPYGGPTEELCSAIENLMAAQVSEDIAARPL